MHTFTSDFKSKIASACKTTTDKVFLSNIHNHQANSSAIGTVVELKIIDAVKEAYNRMVPAVVGVEAAPSNFIVSRGTNLGISWDHPVDNMLTILRFDNAETGEPIGMLWNAPIHNTMLSNGYPANYNKLSCEVSGYASRCLEGIIGKDNENFVAMCIIGFTGMTGPNYNGKYNAATVDDLKEAGNALGVECLEIYDACDEWITGGEISTAMGYAQLPRSERPDMQTNYGTDLMIVTSSFGDICYFGVNYEVFSVLGSHLKAEAPFKEVINAGVSVGSNAYLPTKEVFELDPFYETTAAATCLDARAEDIFYSAAIKAICDTAKVTLERIPSTASPVKKEGSTAVYAYDFGENMQMDKLVISFDQRSRNNCASHFTLKLFDASGKEVSAQTFENLSINHIGAWVDGVSFSRAELHVVKKWQSGEFVTEGIDTLAPAVHGVKFIPIAE